MGRRSIFSGIGKAFRKLGSDISRTFRPIGRQIKRRGSRVLRNLGKRGLNFLNTEAQKALRKLKEGDIPGLVQQATSLPGRVAKEGRQVIGDELIKEAKQGLKDASDFAIDNLKKKFPGLPDKEIRRIRDQGLNALEAHARNKSGIKNRGPENIPKAKGPPENFKGSNKKKSSKRQQILALLNGT